MSAANEQILAYLSRRPALYEKSTAPFWDDPHISAQMLEAHLDADRDAASRNQAFMRRSAAWIAGICPPAERPRLLDLGCGPGLYAELFSQAGFTVTGVDQSRRSIGYAKESAAAKGLSIAYRRQDYLGLDAENAFDAATLIYCDFGVLPPENRAALLQKIRRALVPGGKLILDGFMKQRLCGFAEGQTVQYCETGFWSASPYVCVESHYLYPETDNYVEQYVVITRNRCRCFNNWNQIYTAASLTEELTRAGFTGVTLFGDVAGKPFSEAGGTLCAVCEAVPRPENL